MSAPPQAIQPDLSKAEPVEWEQDRPLKARLKLKDGSTLECELGIGEVLRVGNHPMTGLPVYQVGPTPMIVRLVSSPPTLRKVPAKSGQGPGGYA